MPLLSSQIIDIYSIVDGLNTVKSGIRIGPTELKDCQNIRYFPVGGFMWREGYTTIGSAPGIAGTGLYMGRYSGGTNVAFRTYSTKLEKMDALDGTWDDITGGLTLTTGQNNLFVFDQLNNVVVGVNGVDTPIQVSSALSATHIAGLPLSAPFACYVHRGYMFYLTNDAAWFSDINDAATVGATHFIKVAYRQNGDITGGVDFQGKNFIFKRHGIYSVEYQPTRTDSGGTLFPFIENANPVVPGVGTQSHRSIVKFTTPGTHKNPGQELVFFVDQFGVPRLFDGSVTIALGASIASSRDTNITSLDNTEKTRTPYVWCLTDVANNLIYCFMTATSGTTHTICWTLDYTTGFAWARDSYADAFNAGAIFENLSGIFKPYFINYSGQTMVMNSGQTDNGVAISSYARTGDVFVDKVSTLAKWLYNEIKGSAGTDTQTLTVDYYIDGEDTPSYSTSIILFKQNQMYWDVNNWDEINWVYFGLTTKSSEINLESKTLSVKFSNVTSGNTHTLEGCSLFVIPEGWKQES